MTEEQKASAAMDRYTKNFKSDLFRTAAENLTTEQANWLIDNALHLCGHPNYPKFKSWNWNGDALKFLFQFAGVVVW